MGPRVEEVFSPLSSLRGAFSILNVSFLAQFCNIPFYLKHYESPKYWDICYERILDYYHNGSFNIFI